MWVWTQSVGQLLPQTGRHVLPKDKGLRKPSPPLPLSPPPFSSHLLPPLPEGEAAASLRVSTPPKPAYPPGILGPRALAQAPAHPARGGSFPQARLHSGTRHWLDTAVNPAGRANSGHPQRELGAGPAGKSYLGVAKYQGPYWSLPSLPPMVSLSQSSSFSASHGPHCLWRDPI